MRKRTSYRPYFLFVITLLCLISLPIAIVTRMRTYAVGMVAPAWHRLDIAKASMIAFLKIPVQDAPVLQNRDSSDLEKLRLENLSLRHQLDHLQQLILQEENIEKKWNHLKTLSNNDSEEVFWKKFFRRREASLIQLLDLQYRALSARVIFRDPSSWSSCVWINVGEKNNQQLGKRIVAKNSPVLFGTSLIGVVEYVGEEHSRIRLLTDSKLAVSVRAVRGSQPDHYLMAQIEWLISQLTSRQDLFRHSSEQVGLIQQLNFLKQHTEGGSHQTHYLAKGELRGTSAPLWRLRRSSLIGIGFNYDFEDEEGPARNLRTGEPLDLSHHLPAMPLLKIGDLLVTTGLDGVFPPDLPVAAITKILPLREGGCSYEIEACPCAGHLDELKYVFILPPISLDRE